MKVSVIGSFVMDSVAVVNNFPKKNQIVEGEALYLIPGGAGMNISVSLAKQGIETEIIGVIGNDINGTTCVKVLNQYKIKNDNVTKVARATTVAQVITDSKGNSKKCVVSSANKFFDIKKAQNIYENVKDSNMVVLTDEYGKEITEEILKGIQNNSLRVVYKPLSNVEIEKEFYQNIEYVVLNEEQLAFLTQMPTNTVEEIKNASRALINYGAQNVIVTRGNQGAMAVSSSFCKVVKGFNVNVIDTIAAGDSFTAGFVSAILEQKEIKEAVAYANAVGALTVTKRGAVPSICNKAQAKQFLSKHMVIKK